MLLVNALTSLVKRCDAVCNGSNETGDGFRLLTGSSGVKVMSCCAIGNFEKGFNDSGTSNLFFNNVATGNVGADYVGVGLIVPSGSITAMTGFWASIDGP